MAITDSQQGADLVSKTESLALQLNSLTDSIQANIAAFDSNAEQREKLLGAAKKLLETTRHPIENFMDSLVMTAEFTAMRLFIKWKVFESIPLEGDVSYESLASKVNADTNLISRVAGILVAKKFLSQVGADRVAHTAGSRMFAAPSPMTALIQMAFDDNLVSFVAMPAYFDRYGLKEPAGRYQTIYAFAAGDPDKTVWDHLNSDPERMANFMATMATMSSRMGVVGSYDFGWILPEISKSESRVIVVDVGGGHGHAIKAICQARPEIPVDRCVIEDLEEVINEARENAALEMKNAQFIAADFHKAQPIKGALIYYIRRCLHDYGDPDSIEILQRIRDSMAPDSRLLIAEQIATNPPSAIGAAADLVMASLGGKERTEGGFKYIASRAGLSIRKIFSTSASDISIIECVPVL